MKTGIWRRNDGSKLIVVAKKESGHQILPVSFIIAGGVHAAAGEGHLFGREEK